MTNREEQASDRTTGTLSILNVYEGDVKITFDNTNPAEKIRAKRIVTDMIRRGYALLIEIDGAYQRALDFDETVGEYIIADLDASYSKDGRANQSTKTTQEEPDDDGDQEEAKAEEETAAPAPKKWGRGRRRRVSMESTNAVAIARSAGG